MTKRRHPITPTEWLDHVIEIRGENNITQLRTALTYYSDLSSFALQKGLGIADILLSLGIDNTGLAVACIYPSQQENNEKSLELEWLGEEGNKLLKDVLQMKSLGKLQQIAQDDHQQIENSRKMVLAMMTDVRAILIILAEQLWQLRQAKSLSTLEQKKLAKETLDIHAPLANRLGIWQLKWEMEDLCLRYLKPDIYQEIAKGLDAKRNEREAYVEEMITLLTTLLNQANIKDFKITGRVKHIDSIYKKMTRKNASLSEIYDVTALRVLVSTIQDCYNVLSILQHTWQPFHDEFDDYISHPKPNGYRSIHTVVRGPHDHFIEIQIRTFQMHHESELGVAAHWRYKEGVLQVGDYESKIALLRQIMAWQKEVVNQQTEIKNQPIQDLFADYIYVFTPTGEIIELPKGSTPLDFAYHIHSEIGHRCRGAKIGGNMVTLTHHLQTGDRVEILTTKQANPSRDWLNPQLGYLKTTRARSKVQHWFKLKDTIKNKLTGHELLERELKKIGLSEKLNLNDIALKLNYKNEDTLLSALGSGDIRVGQILHYLRPPETEPSSLPFQETKKTPHEATSHIQISGINHLLTHLALCCKPLPGDAIMGYVSRTRGVTIHRRTCPNMSHILKDGEGRLVDVNWGEKYTGTYSADLVLHVNDRTGLLRDITTLLAGEKINVVGLTTQKSHDGTHIDIYITIEITDKEQLNMAIDKLRKIPQILEVRRR